jgi:hypothetical protein
VSVATDKINAARQHLEGGSFTLSDEDRQEALELVEVLG